MQIDSEQLWGAIQDIGCEADNVPEIPQHVIDKLIEYGLAERGKHGPRLTAYGEKAYVVLESGDGSIPELDEPS